MPKSRRVVDAPTAAPDLSFAFVLPYCCLYIREFECRFAGKKPGTRPG